MIIDVPTKSVLLRTAQAQKLHNLLPMHAKLVEHEGHNIAFHYTLDTMKILRNIGYKVPSPIRHFYDWPGRFTPMAHQIETSEFLTFTRRGFVLSEMGTGKTASVLWALDYLMDQGQVSRTLVVAPMSTLEQVWLQAAFSIIMDRKAVVLKGDADRRRELLASRADIYIVNYEGLPIIAGEVQKRADINLIVVDEAAAYRNGTNDRYKVLRELVKDTNTIAKSRRLWMLTGTPCPNAPTDAWALARLVDPLKVPTYFTNFKRDTMMQVSTYKWVPRVGSAEKAFAALQPAVRYRKADCIDLPPLTFETRDVGLTKDQMNAYTIMKNNFVLEYKQGTVSAVNAAHQITVLRQILLGSVKDMTGNYITIDHAPRLKVLLECIEQAAAKVIVIVPYKGITRVLAQELSPRYSCEIVNGDVSPKERNDIWYRFRNETDPHLALCHPQVMAHGLTLTEADMIIMYGPINSNELSLQLIERINRPGQTRKMTVIRMGAMDLEWDIYKVVEGRKLEQDSILELYRKEMER